MSRDTENFSIYSLMSIRTRFFSLSNSASLRALASSVLPTPVGPRNRKEPMGLSGSAMPARLLRMASLTRRTASSWPTTRWWRMSSRWRSFSRSPSMSLATGMPVQRSMIRAISSSVTLSRSRERALPSAAICSSASRAFFKAGILPYWSSAALFRSYSRWAFSSSALALSRSARSCWTLPMASFSLSHWAFLALNSSRMSDSSFWISARCSWDSRSVSFFRAASSISC